ncbi:oligoribonuclease [Kytococcus sedentarius]|uniref:oligoribonuclease n=1 Tax=Kytococcus sedentarius TaxID=1276 RepID=UPI0035BBD6C1
MSSAEQTQPPAPDERPNPSGNPRALDDRIVWIDCEMTGLERTDVLVEIAALVTDFELNVLGEGVQVVIRPDDLGVLEDLNPVVQEMHTASGLLEEIEHGVSAAEAERMVLEYVREWVPEAGRAPLAGNSIATDRRFLAAEMPELDAYLHYRLIDVSSVKELSKRWFPRAWFNSPDKAGGHRALADIRESIAELAYYREAVFVDAPGPSTDEARAAASRHAVGG